MMTAATVSEAFGYDGVSKLIRESMAKSPFDDVSLQSTEAGLLTALTGAVGYLLKKQGLQFPNLSNLFGRTSKPTGDTIDDAEKGLAMQEDPNHADVTEASRM